MIRLSSTLYDYQEKGPGPKPQLLLRSDPELRVTVGFVFSDLLREAAVLPHRERILLLGEIQRKLLVEMGERRSIRKAERMLKVLRGVIEGGMNIGDNWYIPMYKQDPDYNDTTPYIGLTML